MSDDSGNPSDENRRSIAKLASGIRIDLVIAICALFISSLATAASWWQTRVIEEQFGAQIWPYVSTSEDIDGNTVKVTIVNQGLGPAVLESAAIYVDGKPRASLIDVLHAILGEHLLARSPHGEHVGISISGASPGAVLRPGDSQTALAFTSKRFAMQFLRAYRRIDVRICYCAIVEGKCWFSDSADEHPQPRPSCVEDPHDILHANAVDELNAKL